MADYSCKSCGALIPNPNTCTKCTTCGTDITNTGECTTDIVKTTTKAISGYEVDCECVTATKIIRSAQRKASGHRISNALYEDDLEDFNEIIDQINSKNLQIRDPKIEQLERLSANTFRIPFDLKRVITVSYGTNVSDRYDVMELQYISPEGWIDNDTNNKYTIIDNELIVKHIDISRIQSSDTCKNISCGYIYMLYYPKISKATSLDACLELLPDIKEYIKWALILNIYGVQNRNAEIMQLASKYITEIETRLQFTQRQLISETKKLGAYMD